MLAFNLLEKGNVGWHLKFLEQISEAIGSTPFLCAAVCFVTLWVGVNLYARQLHLITFDAAPFPLLQGVVGLAGLIVTIIVLIKQNLLGKMEKRRAHVEFQVNLLTEQKVTKLINLIEELRRDLPMNKDRIDPESEAYQLPTDPKSVLQALDERIVP
jgi:uncharacterized membrane protein